MSQYPPAMTPPPPGFNPGMPYGAPPPQRRTSAAAVASLICGILGCIPFLSQILAIIFGMVGLSATRKPNVGGRGLAIAGLILGIIGLLLWGGFSGLGGYFYVQITPAQNVAKQFLQDVGSGNLQAAQAESASTMPATTIPETAETLKPLGSFVNVNFFAFDSGGQLSHPSRVTLGGVAMFTSGSKPISMVVVKEGSGYKVESVEIK